MIPFLLNQSGSVLYFLTLQEVGKDIENCYLLKKNIFFKTNEFVLILQIYLLQCQSPIPWHLFSQQLLDLFLGKENQT